MTYPIQPYQDTPNQLPGPPTEFNLGGNKYVLVPAEQQAPVVPHMSMPHGPIINGVLHVPGPNGYQPYQIPQAPYHAHPGHPPWLRNHYTRGTGFLIGAACNGVVLFIVAAALFAIVTWAMANLLAIGITVLVVFFGGMAILGKIASMKHGHPMRR